MRTIGDLSLVTKAVAPFATASVALRSMQESGLRVLSVSDGGRFMGIVTRDRLKFSATDQTVREVVEPLVIELHANTPVRAAARLFAENELDVVPVVSDRGFEGLLTVNQLLIELGRSWDPMTGLSWSDRLRDWGVDSLQSGQEITLAFFDLNDFGEYNKRHGHIVGDRVLKAMAKELASHVNSDTDVLVRYGGDEFVIGTTRTRAELEEIVAELSKNPMNVEGVPETVSYSVGYAGGKRGRERDRVHFASTLDNLINLASQDSIRNKPKNNGHSPPAMAEEVRNVVEVDQSEASTSALVSVTSGGKTAMGHARLGRGSAIQAVAEATAAALMKMDTSLELVVKDIVLYKRWDGNPVAVALVQVSSNGNVEEVRSQGTSKRGSFDAVLEAILDAVNRCANTATKSVG